MASSGASSGSSSSGGGDWWDPKWLQRVWVRFNHAYVRGPVVDTPLPVLLTDAQIPAEAFFNGGGAWRFVTAAGEVVPHVFEPTPTADRLLAWVRVPLIPDRSASTGLWLYFDNADAMAREAPDLVWAGMAAVLLGNGGSNPWTATDATPNGNHGTRYTGANGTGTVGRATNTALGYGLTLSGGGGVEIAGLQRRALPQGGQTLLLVTSSPGSAGSVFGPPSTTEAEAILSKGPTNVYTLTANLAPGTIPTFSYDATTWNVMALTMDNSGSSTVLQPIFNDSLPPAADVGGWLPAAQRYLFGSGLNSRLDFIMVANSVLTRDQVMALSEAFNGYSVVVGPATVPGPVAERTLPRVTGAQVLYEFDEGTGAMAFDTSGLAPALDLMVEDETRVQWLRRGIRILQGTNLLGPPAARLTQACAANGNITVEAWLMADHEVFSGPARIFSVSTDTAYRNFTLVQGRGDYALRYRTDLTGGNGTSTTDGTLTLLTSGPSTVDATQPQHVVFTRDNGIMTSYINGALAGSRMWPGSPAPAWDDTYRIMVGNESDGGANTRSWLGTIYLLAVWCRALDATEVMQNYAAGP